MKYNDLLICHRLRLYLILCIRSFFTMIVNMYQRIIFLVVGNFQSLSMIYVCVNDIRLLTRRGLYVYV